MTQGLKKSIALTTLLTLVLVRPVTGADRVITNEDAISMVRSGLSDSAIITAIERSRTRFDLSPGGLVKLRQAGVSNAVIETMLKMQSPEASRKTVGKAQAGELPSAYGYYVLDGGKLRAMQPVPVDVVVGLRVGGFRAGPGWGVDGFRGEPAEILESAEPIFIVYQQNVNLAAFRFSELQFLSSLQAWQFNVKGTRPEFFSNVYGGVRPNNTVVINLWRPKTPEPLRVEPIEGRQGMFRLIPKLPLVTGRYALWFGDGIHSIDMVFATDGSQRSSAFYMGVGSFSKTSSSGRQEKRSNSFRGSPIKTDARQKDVSVLITEGRGYYQANNWIAAEESYKGVLEVDAENYEGHGNLGSIYLRLGDFEKAAVHTRKAMNLRPDEPNPYYNMACIYAKMGEAEKAIILLRQAVAKGFKDFEQMTKDPDLESIRDDPRFKTLSGG